jgi:hypothetical protein
MRLAEQAKRPHELLWYTGGGHVLGRHRWAHQDTVGTAEAPRWESLAVVGSYVIFEWALTSLSSGNVESTRTRWGSVLLYGHLQHADA